MGGGILVLIIATATWPTMNPKVRLALRLFGGVLLAGPIGFTLWKADTFFKLDGLHFDFSTKGSNVTQKPSPINILFSSSNPTAKLECLDDEKIKLFPFLDGTSEIDPTKVDVGLKTVRDWVNQKRSENARMVGLFLIGSADKRPLSLQLRRKYGNNRGLAVDRANTIARDIEKNMDIPRSSIMTIYDGPSLFGDIKSSVELGPDRAVRICALWD
jgi:hypothetical protein